MHGYFLNKILYFFCIFCILAERRAFEQKRKMHYNEFQAVKLARQLMEDPDEEDEEDEEESTEAHQNEASDAANTQAEPGPSSEKP